MSRISNDVHDSIEPSSGLVIRVFNSRSITQDFQQLLEIKSRTNSHSANLGELEFLSVCL